jgi:hypothetical protein
VIEKASVGTFELALGNANDDKSQLMVERPDTMGKYNREKIVEESVNQKSLLVDRACECRH